MALNVSPDTSAPPGREKSPPPPPAFPACAGGEFVCTDVSARILGKTEAPGDGELCIHMYTRMYTSLGVPRCVRVRVRVRVLCEPRVPSACTAFYNATRDPRWGHRGTRRRDALYRGRFPWFCLILHCFGVLSRDRAPAKCAEQKCKIRFLSRLARPFRQKNFFEKIITALGSKFFEGRECVTGHIYTSINQYMPPPPPPPDPPYNGQLAKMTKSRAAPSADPAVGAARGDRPHPQGFPIYIICANGIQTAPTRPHEVYARKSGGDFADGTTRLQTICQRPRVF